MPERYDVIIIGTGAGGGTLAHTLAPSGKKILLIERGDFLPRERENWEPDPVFIEGRYISPDTWYDPDGKPFQPQVHYYVGGATKMYGAALYRLRPQDFGEIEARRRRLPRVAVVLRRLRAVVFEGRAALPGARQPRRGSERGALEPAVSVAGGLARTQDPAARRRPHGRRISALPRALRHHAQRGTPREEHVHPLHLVRWLPLPGAREVGCRIDRGSARPDIAERDPAREHRSGEARNGPERYVPSRASS